MATFNHWGNSLSADQVLKRINEFDESTAGYLVIRDIGGLEKLHQAMNALVPIGWRAVSMSSEGATVIVLMFREPSE